ncbi:uncharacterized protein CLUP02_10151 [Colletotrichum lupini]|uniref:Uncharacterized protein n=1 Tax=Colletotrichum lupini TaxID=145971 RepID=A0A9Q8SWZ7_9PEZI|nr:uncharacterized protein CLUP02_10151 [Colletotrichum lupini]UQC84655.1 hypothetical protein CLUP02_10151 [Colletotrichum lupini]
MSWGKGYLEPYHAATRYDLDPSHASPAFVQKANTGKMNKEGNVDRLEGFRRGRGQCYLMHMASRKPHDARCTPLPKFSNRVVLERRDEAGLCLIHEPAQVNVTLQVLKVYSRLQPLSCYVQPTPIPPPPPSNAITTYHYPQPIRRHGDGVQRWEGNVATLRLPLRSVALGTAVAGIRCDVASCFHSCASEEERKMRLTYGSILEASKKAKKEFTLLRRCSKFEVCSSFANQNSRKFSPPPGIQRQVPAQPGPRQGKTRVSRHRGKGMMCLGVLGYRYLRCVIHRSLLDARGPFLFPDGGHEQDGWGEPKGTACIPSQRPAVARVPDGDGDVSVRGVDIRQRLVLRRSPCLLLRNPAAPIRRTTALGRVDCWIEMASCKLYAILSIPSHLLPPPSYDESSPPLLPHRTFRRSGNDAHPQSPQHEQAYKLQPTPLGILPFRFVAAFTSGICPGQHLPTRNINERSRLPAPWAIL